MAYHCRLCGLVIKGELPKDAILLPGKSRGGYHLYHFGGHIGEVHELKYCSESDTLMQEIPVVEEVVTPPVVPEGIASLIPDVLASLEVSTKPAEVEEEKPWEPEPGVQYHAVVVDDRFLERGFVFLNLLDDLGNRIDEKIFMHPFERLKPKLKNGVRLWVGLQLSRGTGSKRRTRLCAWDETSIEESEGAKLGDVFEALKEEQS